MSAQELQSLKERTLTTLKDFLFFIQQSWRDFRNIPYVDTTWLLVWISIYIGFIFLDFTIPGHWGSSLLKYLGIFLCTIYAYQKTPKDTTLLIALFFTFLADTILVWTPYELIGLIIFCFAQFMHTQRLSNKKIKTIVCYLLVLLAMDFISITQNIPALYALALFYAIAIFTNLFLSARNFRKNKNKLTSRAALYGFIAFIACDFCVAVRHLMLDGLLPAQFLPLIAFLVWVFYYPSQVLLANSSTLPTTKQSKIAK